MLEMLAVVTIILVVTGSLALTHLSARRQHQDAVALLALQNLDLALQQAAATTSSGRYPASVPESLQVAGVTLVQGPSTASQTAQQVVSFSRLASDRAVAAILSASGACLTVDYPLDGFPAVGQVPPDALTDPAACTWENAQAAHDAVVPATNDGAGTWADPYQLAF